MQFYLYLIMYVYSLKCSIVFRSVVRSVKLVVAVSHLTCLVLFARSSTAVFDANRIVVHTPTGPRASD